MEHRVCPVCGQPLAVLRDRPDAGRAACPTGHFVHYDNPALTPIWVALSDFPRLALAGERAALADLSNRVDRAPLG